MPLLPLAVLLAVLGCKHHPPMPVACEAVCGSTQALPLADDKAVRFRLKDIPQLAPSPEQHQFEYRQLNGMQAQCFAVAASLRANLLERERELLASNEPACNHPQLVQLNVLKDQVLVYSAEKDRNESAAAALELYFQLADAESQRLLLEESLSQLDTAMRKTRDLIKQGLATQTELEDLRRQEIDVQARKAELQSGVTQLNSGLRILLKLDDCLETTRFQPSYADLMNFGVDIDCAAAIHVGLANHPQLLLFRTVEGQLNAVTVPVAMAVLQSVHAAIGTGSRIPICPPVNALLRFLDCTDPAEVHIRGQQLRQLIADRERTLAEEIEQSVEKLNARARLILLARDRVRSLQTRTEDLKDKRARGLASFAQETTAALEELRGQAQLLERIRDWHLALVELKKTQGILARECQGPDLLHSYRLAHIVQEDSIAEPTRLQIADPPGEPLQLVPEPETPIDNPMLDTPSIEPPIPELPDIDDEVSVPEPEPAAER